MSLLADLDRSLAAAPVSDRDAAGVTLARLIAMEIDSDPGSIAILAPKLTVLLKELGLLPGRRKEVSASNDDDDSGAALAEVIQFPGAIAG